MLQLNKETKEQLELLLYKILNDALLLWIIVFLGLLILEGLVPGYFSAYLSFTKMTLALFLILFFLGYLGKRNRLSFRLPYDRNQSKKKLLSALLVIFFVLTLNSARNIGWFGAAIISIGAFSSIIYLYQILILGRE